MPVKDFWKVNLMRQGCHSELQSACQKMAEMMAVDLVEMKVVYSRLVNWTAK